jgi:hypothetical protein
MGRPRLPAAEKACRGTLRPHRERKADPVATTSRGRSEAHVESAHGADAILVELLAKLHAEQRAQREMLTDILQRLDAGRLPPTGHGPRDDADGALVQTIAAAVGRRRFTARELLAHGRVDAPLAAAIAATDTDSARELGKLFQRLEGRPCSGGVVLERVDVSRDGLVWAVRVLRV